MNEWDKLSGAAPDATGGMSSEAFVRQLRDSEGPVRSGDFPFTTTKECPTCGHKTPNLPTPPFYCLHCDATWSKTD